VNAEIRTPPDRLLMPDYAIRGNLNERLYFVRLIVTTVWGIPTSPDSAHLALILFESRDVLSTKRASRSKERVSIRRFCPKA
jgi:hypothetical protein